MCLMLYVILGSFLAQRIWNSYPFTLYILQHMISFYFIMILLKKTPHMMQLRSQRVRHVRWNRKPRFTGWFYWQMLLLSRHWCQALCILQCPFQNPGTLCASMCVRGSPCLTKPPKLWLQLKVNCHCPLIRNVAPCFVWRGSHCLRATELLHK